ncbi:hypothetical protein EXIGLDRAFT_465400 [Exidia glandulosa HHB12029]|uniref:Uncharacterized protein n=1 Tax=Exidia glandulosa HHB12029 TaxID=1314781 RepID=A0A165K2S2_EXIGL|nr:hypothetical protein EXIGLDRAFT_465400 [Exidia glandulosa HHB12029]
MHTPINMGYELKSADDIAMPAPAFAPQPFSPPAYSLRVPNGSNFPGADQTGPAATFDKLRPVFLGLAHVEGGLHPCKVMPDFAPNPVRVGYGGGERSVETDFFVVPVDASRMEWVAASHGRTPEGRTPVEAGHENDGTPLYHAVALVDGLPVPGKCGPGLRSAHVPYGGVELVREYYQILCWRL